MQNIAIAVVVAASVVNILALARITIAIRRAERLGFARGWDACQGASGKRITTWREWEQLVSSAEQQQKQRNEQSQSQN